VSTAGGGESTCTELLVKDVNVLVDPGGNVDWSPDGSWIAYDAPTAEGWTQTWRMKPDGSERTCLTCENPAAPTRLHLGNPTWHPGMAWIVVQGVRESFYQSFPSNDSAYKKQIMDAGVGIGNDLWAMSADGTRFVRLTDVRAESGFSGGVLHAHFSHNGSLLAWTQRVGNENREYGGKWVIRLAEFDVSTGVPALGNVRTLAPGKGTGTYEVHSFSPDDSTLIFSTNADGQGPFGWDLYLLNITDGSTRRLTDTPREWDEHGHYHPSGACLVWMSSRDAGSTRDLLKTELWLMAPGGADVRRLTAFNDAQSAMFDDTTHGVIPSDSAWSPDGTFLAVYVITNQGPKTQYSMPGRIVLLSLAPGGSR
jgi:Tol biopolymer transport system component